MSIITITDAAAAHIKNMMVNKNDGAGFRLSIKKTGCSGYSYVPDIVTEPKQNDIHFVVHDLNVYVDSSYEDILTGVVVDYVADNTGLKQKRLVFINPHEKNRCGCGESFTLE
jgi:iron-sulfur cluster assembly accessory protein